MNLEYNQSNPGVTDLTFSVGSDNNDVISNLIDTEWLSSFFAVISESALKRVGHIRPHSMVSSYGKDWTVMYSVRILSFSYDIQSDFYLFWPF